MREERTCFVEWVLGMNRKTFIKYLGFGSLLPFIHEVKKPASEKCVPIDPLKIGDFVKCKRSSWSPYGKSEGYGVITKVEHGQGISYAVDRVEGYPEPHKHAWYDIDEFEYVIPVSRPNLAL